MDYRHRYAALVAALRDLGADCIVATHLPNVRYLTGFTGSSAIVVVPRTGCATLITDGRYTAQAREQVRGARVRIARGPLLADAAPLLGGAVAIEADHVTVQQRNALQKLLPRRARLKNSSAVVERLRLIKDKDELGLIRKAVRLGSDVFEAGLRSIAAGTAETAVAAEIEYAARQCGADGMSFDTIVAGGARSALPHGRASAAKLPQRGFVVIDSGVILAGYCSDMTRTVHLGTPGTARRMYEAVREAQQAATERVCAGVTAGEVDAAARGVLQKAGLARFFTHSTGHGVGLEIHEAPRLAKDQKVRLEAGMVITIEPGAYIPGRGGVRIEDMVVVTERGCEVLTRTPKDLITL
jgi:Xaa-Pro aminopeptidase